MKSYEKNTFNLEQDITTLEISKAQTSDNCYIHEKGNIRLIYYNFILDENSQSKIICSIRFDKHNEKFIPRLTFRKVDKEFIQKQHEVQKDVIINMNDYKISSKFWNIINFLKNFKDLVDCNDFEKNYALVKNDFITEFNTKNDKERIDELLNVIENSNLTTEDIVKALTLKERENNLKTFKAFLDNKKHENKTYFEKYKIKYNINEQGEETIWQDFIKKHSWIIGLNGDIKFISDLIPEQKIGNENSQAKDSPKVDFIGRISNYTILIELKTSNTKIFTNKKNNKTARTNTWSFSSEFIDGISQCLAQKFSFDKNYANKDFLDENNNLINKNIIRTIDPKVIFIIGNREKEFPSNGNTDNITKNETFERFKRNNKHIEIITFDELYQKAYFIVHEN